MSPGKPVLVKLAVPFSQMARWHRLRTAFHVVADEENCPSLPRHIFHLTETFLLKFSVTDGQDLIQNENFRIQMRRHAEGKTHIHAAAVSFYRGVHIAFDFGKSDDFIKLRLDFGFLFCRCPVMPPLRKTFSRPVRSG